ncbi:putative bifunctional diguanylate cyclase/phosphodiesterase [Agitococcus lubricus]|uniref:Diguanylate cyclase (GGDEF)-like protein n=1 Tax=Agitococcus lubricus TaxID=1077255 RepID=A0A2T5IUH6_9GAMM|nr:bifunctional diguanylate cyclase/phosphodiesterase [Agitococcus lubricus]PTQ87510.1 diguanylate cyclase (GGDEF)-like protein [Agitococcus lubricus]
MEHTSSLTTRLTTQHSVELVPALAMAMTQAHLVDAVEQAAAFGRWWFDIDSQQLVLSRGAALLLDVHTGLHDMATGFMQVLAEDSPMLEAALNNQSQQLIECEFRIINELDGLRWLRLVPLPQMLSQPTVKAGVLVDITAAKHAEMRERFSLASTQLLVGANSLGKAIIKVIQLVCENLGWEWGAYWAVEQETMGAHKLACKYYWHDPEYPMSAFTQESTTIRMGAGEGLVGGVWHTAQASWVEDIPHDRHFLRRKGAMLCGLQSGYAFPVSYMTADGRRHSPGVMEFFSKLSRQKEAQLPALSSAIGTLVAQTVQRMEQQESIRQLAQIDDLTGLSNRNHFNNLLDAACLNATSSAISFAVLFIDLDRFKPINDAFGHDAGNVVLREFAHRLQAIAVDGGAVGRLGGDEFALLTKPAMTQVQLKALAERVLLAARTPFFWGEQELTVSASVGIALFPDNGWTGAELVRNADIAMYRSKQQGRNAISFISEQTSADLAQEQSSLVQQLTMEAELHHALINHDFFLEYQPLYDFSRGGQKMIAIEALIRWRRKNGDLVPPDVFIPIAEQSRLIVQIGRWVLGQACRDLAKLQQAGWGDLQMHINMAAPEFINAKLPTELLGLMEAYNLSPKFLCLEMTEGMVMKQPDKLIPVMSSLRQLGFKISLDDFGMGHSSLSRLKKLPISYLKIDRSFIYGLPQDKGDKAIVRTILDLGRHMNVSVIAEGVENDAQFAFLRQFGCSLIQGFVLSRPKSLAELMAMSLDRRYQSKVVLG